MSKSFPYNVVLTKSAEVAEKLFFDKDITGNTVNKRRLNSIYGGLSKEEIADTVIVSPFSNNGFISLINELPMGGGNKFVTLKMMETSTLLEKFLIPSNAQEELVFARFKKRIKNSLELDADTLDILKNIRPRFYLAYGIGDDVSQWSGPFIIDLIDANLTITSEGLRELELVFTPTLDTLGVFTNKIFKDEDLAQGRSVFDTNRTSSPSIETRSESTFELTESFIADAGNLRELNLDGDRWNFAIRKLIRQFISDKYSTVPKGNVLVLFNQDLDKDSSDKNAPFKRKKRTEFVTTPDFVSLYQDVLAEYGITSYYPLKPEVAKEIEEGKADYANRINKGLAQEGPAISKDIEKVLINKLPGTEGILPPGRAAPGRADVSDLIRVNNAILRAEEIILTRELTPDENKALNSLLVERDALLKNVKIEVKSKPIPLETAIINNFVEQVEKARASNQDLAMENSEVIVDDTKITLAFYADYVLSDIDDNVLESLRPLYKFFSKLKTKITEKFDPIFLEENDIKLTSLLKRHNLIEDSKAPVIILGDRDLINSLIYDNNFLPNNLGKTLSYSFKPKETKDAWFNYKKDLTATFYADKSRTSSMGEQVDFGPYVGFEKRIKDDSLIFMHNLKNSNVIDVSFDASPYKGELLNIANESTYRLLNQGLSTDEEQTLLDNTLKFNSLDYIAGRVRSQVDDLNDPSKIVKYLRGDKSSLSLLKQIGDSSAKDFLDLLIFKLKGQDVTHFKRRVPPGTVATYEANTLKKASSYILQATIKTLPFFNTNIFLGRHCLLVGAPNRVIGSPINRERGQLPEPAVFSNGYNIYGYKHVIEVGQAYSEFTLYQNGHGADAGDSMRITVAELLDIDMEPDSAVTGEAKDFITEINQVQVRVNGRNLLSGSKV